jgi:amino acid adenylation domain-containing protein
MKQPFEPQLEITAVDFNPFAEGELSLTAPATESQKEIWASVQMGDDANCAYNESQSLRLLGQLNIEALQAALKQLVLRHEALRTTFSANGSTLCIVASQDLEIPFLDLSDLNTSQQEAKVASLCQQVVKEPFDIEHGPLFRVQILKLQPLEHFLLITAHHIICDGWSWAVLIPDLGNLYSALKQGLMPSLDEPERFSDYASTIEREADDEEATETEQFWLQQFSDSVPTVDFPTDRPRPIVRTFDAARYDHPLSSDLVSDLKQLGTQLGCSFMTTLLAGFETFLYRLTGQSDLVVGISAAGQAASGQYGLVGHCVNLLPLRTQIDPQQSFSDYLKSRKSTVLDAYDHQQFTFGRLVQKLSLPRDSSRIPLVPITFNLDQGLDSSKLPFNGLEVEVSSNPRSYENFELYLNATELGGQLTLECQYNTNLFDAETIRRRLVEFEVLLSGIAKNPNTLISRLPILPAAEQQLLEKWNQVQTSYPQSLSIHRLVEAQVERTPDAIAVTYEAQSLTYSELNRQANRLAHYLQSQGVAPEVKVGLCLERSLNLIVSILGILKAGGAYVPLDPDYPQDRLAYMLEDAQVSQVVTQSALAANLSIDSSKLICLDTEAQAIAQQSQENLQTDVTANHLAYIIYTSGSTGKPKGVLVPHGNVTRLFEATQDWYKFSRDDVWTCFHSCAFDFSVWEIWGALLYGGRLVVVPYIVSRSPKDFYHLLLDESVTVLNQTPSAFRQLVKAEAEAEADKKLSLRYVIFGGEALDIQSLRPWFERHGDRQPKLVNMYGITETTVHVTYRPLSMTDLNGTASVIGSPIPDLQLYLLDPNQQRVPIGIPGELCVGGAGLARGYLNRPELTRERFIVNPFKDEASLVPASEFLYRSGDLARYLANGDIEYLGRLDHQVKLRGFRIELGEIEAVLAQQFSVQENIVLVREDTPGDQRLVAYVIPKSGQSPTANELRHALKQKLPDYMVPGIFLFLDALPLTASGKVDRKALPKPDVLRSELGDSYIAPRNEIELQMAEIWEQVLNLKPIGIYDNFFDLGGHSLLATQAIARSRKVFTIELTLRHFFEAPTIAGLSERVETIRWMTQGFQVPQTDSSDAYEEGEL